MLRQPVTDGQRFASCLIAFLAGWLWYLSAWAEYSPARILYLTTGNVVQPYQLWAVGDAVLGFHIWTRSLNRWWGLALLALYIGQSCCHIIYGKGGVSFPVYAETLNLTFGLQVVCLIVAGGPHARNWIGSAADRWITTLRSHRAGKHALARSEEIAC